MKGGGRKEGQGKQEPSKKVSRSPKAGLQFPVGRIARYLKTGKYAKRVGTGAPVCLPAVLECLATEVLELAGNVARDNLRKRIIPSNIQLVVHNDPELSEHFARSRLPRSVRSCDSWQETQKILKGVVCFSGEF